MDKKVQILMSTYNGERFIRKQLDSIVNQDYEISLLIRDDGSSDSTVKIIKEYQERYSYITLVEGVNIGVVKSFFELLRNSDPEADYYSLADQDDIWFTDKISRAVRKLGEMDNKKPCLYCARQTLIDCDDNILDVKMKEVHIRPGFGNAIVENIATGCTCVINKKLRDIAASYEPEYTVMHDWWLYMLAAYMGEIYFDDAPCMYYRQHGSNTMGSRTNYIEEFKERVKRFSANKNKLYRQLAAFNERYSLDGENKEIVDMVLGHKKSLRNRVRCIVSKKIYRQRKLDNFIFKVLFMTDHI